MKTPTLLIIGQLDRTALRKNLVSEDVRKTLGNYPELGKLTHEKLKGSQLVELDGGWATYHTSKRLINSFSHCCSF
jgi:hypothetical protein